MADVEAPAPSMPARLRATYDVSPEAMRVIYRPRSWGATVFGAAWLVGWTVGCVFLARELVLRPQLFLLLFAIPFWSAWLFVACWLLSCIVGEQTLEVDTQGLRYTNRVLIRLTNRWIPRDEFRSFEVVERQLNRGDSDSTPRSGLEICTSGKALFVLGGLPDAELRWLAHQLSQLIDSTGGESASRSDQVQPAAPRFASDEFSKPLALAEQPVEPPSDCSWELVGEFAAQRFEQCGTWSWSAVLGLLFLNCFWNGVVGVFVLVLVGVAPGNGPRGMEWWFLFVFLIPFELVGLVMFLVLVGALVEPVRRTAWQFDSQGIESRQSWLGIGPRRSYPVESLARIDLVRVAQAAKNRKGVKQSIDSGGWEEGEKFALSLVRPDNTQLCQIKPLTEGEARWMADVILRERAEWFR